MNSPLPRMCVIAATRLSIHFFLKPHLRELALHFQVTVASNPQYDTYLPPLKLPIREVDIDIKRKISPWGDVLALVSLFRLFRKGNFDIVVTVVPKAGLLGMLAAFMLRIPFRVHIFQGEVWASRKGFMRFLLKRMDALTARLATHILAVSPSEKRFLEMENVVPLGRVQVLGSGSICGVDTEKFKPDNLMRRQVRAQLGIPEEAVVCIFLGRLALDKGVIDLGKAFARSAKYSTNLWLIYVGPDEENMQDRLRKLIPGLLLDRTRILGFTNCPQKMLIASDFLCLPSYREGFGMVILEAASVGIPSIGTRIYGVTDAIEEGLTGQLVSVGDIDALSFHMTRWCNFPDERRQFAAAARSRVISKFQQKVVVDNYVRFFRNLFQ